MSAPDTAAPDAQEGPLAVHEAPHRLGPLEQIPVGEGRAFGVDGQQIAVFRVRSGSVYALSAVCPHRGGPLADGQLDERQVLCPLHLNGFELATGCSTTGESPLTAYRVEVDGTGDVLLYLHGAVRG
ncbi:Rieske (2Fe-2S) protein [Nakamurella leprariae]|uniref:Nitrite reductase (NAD(P)H) small subunit n=1 Tax=Nakamurella leprariae TaxID=2803911 RepID=A0A938YBW1_9ACTN|nr:Rieske 2Fe-2S domain-containing protein [Nakamurella leprariae]MBM9466746.1 nitrite reductase (NAD(P)H) small subunit [Nakamurella leprariae]